MKQNNHLDKYAVLQKLEEILDAEYNNEADDSENIIEDVQNLITEIKDGDFDA